LFCPAAQQAGFLKIICGLPPVIRFGGTLQPIPVVLRTTRGFFVFILQLSKLALDKTKNPRHCVPGIG
jgi:hypothetical protein